MILFVCLRIRLSYAYVYVMCVNADSNADPRQCTPGTPDICHQNATCTQITPHVCACNPASSHRCECNQGYTGDGLNCTGESKVSIVISNITKFSFVSGITWLVLVEMLNVLCRLFYYTHLCFNVFYYALLCFYHRILCIDILIYSAPQLQECLINLFTSLLKQYK